MMNVNAMLAGLRDLVDNPTPRIPVGLCLDTSGSMRGLPIQELEQGVQQYLTEMCSDDLTRYSAETAVVTFDNQAVCRSDFKLPDDLMIHAFQPQGLTCMGEGLMLMLDLLEKRKSQYKAAGVDYYQPVLVVMSDGEPNGDPAVLHEAIARVGQLVHAGKLTVVAVGVGPEVDMEMLARISPKRAPVRLDGLQLREFFAWLSQSVSQIAVSQSGDEDLDMNALAALAAETWPDKYL